MPTKLLIVILLVGLLTACGSQPTNTPASLPTEEPASPTQAVTNASAPTDTAIPATEAVSQGTTVSFAVDIQPLLKSRCGNCHGGNKTEEGLNLLSYASLIQGSDNGLVVNAGSADNSLLVEQVVSQEMPKRGPKLTPPQVQLIIDWINQGALDN
jgi:mono/diheme cytochrome c family protein